MDLQLKKIILFIGAGGHNIILLSFLFFLLFSPFFSIGHYIHFLFGWVFWLGFSSANGRILRWLDKTVPAPALFLIFFLYVLLLIIPWMTARGLHFPLVTKSGCHKSDPATQQILGEAVTCFRRRSDGPDGNGY